MCFINITRIVSSNSFFVERKTLNFLSFYLKTGRYRVFYWNIKTSFREVVSCCKDYENLLSIMIEFSANKNSIESLKCLIGDRR